MRKHSLKDSFRFAGNGLIQSLREEANLRIHLCAGSLVLLFSEVLELSGAYRAILMLCIALVISAELFNTALEATVDLCTQAIHPLARKAKNVAAGAVLVCAIGAAAAGASILLPALLHQLPQLLAQAPQRTGYFGVGAVMLVLSTALMIGNAMLRKTASASSICGLVAAVCALALYLRPTWQAAALAVISLFLATYARIHNAHHTVLSALAGLGLGAGGACIIISML